MTYDLFIIGGGINGCGIARDAAGRGLKVFLAEQGDLASGTSSASTKLIHGGLRYLEHYEFRLVREALIEREVLLKAAPHIIWPLRFVLPYHNGLRPWPILRMGLFLYDHLGGRKILPGTRGVNLRTDVTGKPLKEQYVRGYEYSDCWVEDARLVVLNARGAQEKGAVIRTRTKCTSARRVGDHWEMTIETEDGRVETVRARALINSAGPWVSQVLGAVVGRNDPDKIRMVKGSHLVVDKLYDHDRCYIFQNADGRICFAIPYERDFTLIGTTDEDHKGDPGSPHISEAESEYLLKAVSEYFRKPVTHDMVRWAYSGIRPLYDDGASKAQEATRDYVLKLDHPEGGAPLLSVFGGKITTFRRLSEHAMEKIGAFFPQMGKPWTHDAPMPGGNFGYDEVEARIATLSRKYPFLDEVTVGRLFRAYGTDAEHVLGDARTAADLGQSFGPISEREVDWLREKEWARSADDVLWRRSKLGLHTTKAQQEALRSYMAAANAVQELKRVEVEAMPDMILAIDQGTTSSRAIVFDAKLKPVSVGQQEFRQFYPKSGWVEHDPEEIWASVLATCKSALRKAKAKPSSVKAIGITNQRETVVIWNRRTGRPIHKAIVWQDRRTAEFCAALKAEGREALFSRKTGLLLDPYFSGTKIRWLLDNVKGARAKAERGELAFGTIDSFLIWRLTGGKVHATDATNASRTLLFNIHTGQWDEELLRILDIPASLLPEVKDCAADFGTTAPSLFGAAIPICGVAGDQQAASIGQACFEPGMMKATYGTGCFALLNTGSEAVLSRNRLLTTIAYQLEGKRTYALEGAIFIAGAAVQWLRDGLKLVGTAGETGKLAAAADPTQSVYLVPAFVGLGAPYWNAEARGAIFGLTRATTRSELAKASLESVCYQTRDLLEAMRKDMGHAQKTILRVDGGMSASDWTMQRLADMLDAPVDRPPILETTALGAAYLAGLKVGILPEPARFARSWKKQKRFTPKMKPAERNAKYAGWKDAVRKLLA